MNTKEINILRIATVFIVLSIVFGALGAHALEKVLSEEKLTSFEVGVKYQMYHGIALLALIGLNTKLQIELKVCFRFLISGVLLFSGSLYVLSLQGLIGLKLGMVFGPLTPIGGLLMIAGWLVFLVKISKSKLG
jgi:uncharacterized membrane protein YgdD (TMEM256/DUF423 family)